jgi:hypothetical protein
MAKLDPIVSEFSSDEAVKSYDKWFRTQVETGLKSQGPWHAHEDVMVEAREILGKAIKHARRSLGS